MGIKIYELHPNHDAQFIQEATPGEMINIKGGFGRRRRRNPSTTLESSDISALMEDINTNLDRWRMDIDTTLEDLRQSINF
ncbi:hypothetical protein [Sphaerospermopsis torques-reginae]|jgi:hypothetical protein|uniref:Uncharacterized protein n=1 Tax=Sphaerospermopsis torques-reginae ITEP-024 TaxID=984208 RepID=A0ABX8X507_9CYAN|nr:hypothetical protein [Sphaerospermopsis torques-reginae]QYX33788.1 hypothetical protein K2F26_11055 [Sphaerospermopsis torques-reginae ITEP-024]